MDSLWSTLQYLFGTQTPAHDLDLVQMLVRAGVIYLVGLVLLRAGEHRFIGKNTAFDIVLGFIFGSLLSRAVNGSAPLLETVVAAAVLLSLHYAFSALAFRSDRFDAVMNGSASSIVRDGAADEDALRRNRISDRLLRENLRLHGHTDDLDDVVQACYERNGHISVITRRHREPRVVEVDVEDGVQTVRIVLD